MTDARDLLRELLAEALAGANGGAPAPVFPPPPVAAVHRPPGWNDAPEAVAIASDDDLARFAAALAARCEDPAQRAAIREGRVRFALARDRGAPHAARDDARPHAGAAHVHHGAVTERAVMAAAKAGGRIVLGPRAVVTPLAREKARALGIDFERER